MSKILQEDITEIVSDAGVPWEQLRNSTILITGATGTIGSALVRALHAANQKHGLGVKILAFGRDTQKAKQLAEQYCSAFYAHDIRVPLTVNGAVDYIFHCASVTKSPAMVANPLNVIDTALKGTENVLKLAKIKSVKSVVYLSSMEVYGNTDSALQWVTENDLGYISLKSPRSCYPESKRMCECLCNCYFAQYGVPVKTARLAQTFGAGTSKNDTLVVAQFARNALSGENITLHTEGKSYGNYCYISDAVRGLFYLLLRGENSEAYNIANPAACMPIREMAELVANEVCGGKISVVLNTPLDIKNRGYAPDVTRRLSVEKIKKLGWIPKYGLMEMYQRMLADWREE